MLVQLSRRLLVSESRQSKLPDEPEAPNQGFSTRRYDCVCECGDLFLSLIKSIRVFPIFDNVRGSHECQ